MSVLVLGAAGTLGARITRHFGWPGLDLRASAPPEAFAPVAAASVVLNLSGPRARPELTASDYLREHVGLAARLVHAMRPGAHLVHVSSTSVFGRRSATLSPGDREDPSSFPLPDYATAKLAAETYVRAEAPARGLRLSVLRPSMVYGDGVESALGTLLRLHRRGVPLALRPRACRQHLTSAPLLLAAVAAATRTPTGPSPLLVVDPFVLTNADLAPPGLLQLPLDVQAVAARPPATGRLGFWKGVLAVLGVDNELEFRSGFAALGLDPGDFGRERVFAPYWRGGGR